MAKAKDTIRIFARDLQCSGCGAQVYGHRSREFVVDISATVKCKVCGKPVEAKALEGATDVLTPEEAIQFLPGGSAKKTSGAND